MTIQNITYYARVEAQVEASSPAEAETLIREALGNTPPALYINGEDVIYDFGITEFDAAQ